MQRCRHNFSVMSGSICCFILPYNGLAKLHISCNGGTKWQWTCARKTSALQSLHPQIGVRSGCSQVWMCSSGVISALRSVRSPVFCSWIIRTSVLIFERYELHRQLVGVAPRWSKTQLCVYYLFFLSALLRSHQMLLFFNISQSTCLLASWRC